MIRAEAVWKEFRQPDQTVVALRDVSVSIAEGDFVAVTGESGSGKSTLISLLGALDRPTRGDVLYRGTSLSGASPEDMARLRLERIGFVFQEFHLVRHITVEDNIALPLSLRGVDGTGGRVERLLARVGLLDRRRRRPGDLSLGERQRVAVARALVNHPEVLIADEPTASLDRRNADLVWGLLEELGGEGLTIIVATHSAELAARASRVIRLRDGVVDADG